HHRASGLHARRRHGPGATHLHRGPRPARGCARAVPAPPRRLLRARHRLRAADLRDDPRRQPARGPCLRRRQRPTPGAGSSVSVTAARADAPQTSEELLPAPVRRRQRGLRWWKEVLYVLAFYLVYSAIRNTQGSAAVSAAHALHNAMDVIRIEKAVGLFHEVAIQHAAITAGRFFIEFW